MGRKQLRRSDLDKYAIEGSSQADISGLKVSGNGDIPSPWLTFESCSFSTEILFTLKALGFPSPTPIQACCWSITCSRRNMIGVAKTGSGKTLAFVVPSFDRIRTDFLDPRRTGSPIILVLAPTRELACQIRDEASKIGQPLQLRCACLVGGQPWGPQLKQLRAHPHMVVACLGRLLDCTTKKKVYLGAVHMLILDEADRMLDMGFEPQVREVVGQLPTDRQTTMFSATWPRRVQRLAQDFLRSPIHVQIGSDELSCNANVVQEVCLCHSQGEKMSALLRVLQRFDGSRVIVFVNQKVSCSEFLVDLKRSGINAVALHGDLEQADRDRALDSFRRARNTVIVATDVAARGLDVKDVKAVVCYDIALDKETHVHRVGRTGRAGASGVAVTLVQLSDKRERDMTLQVLEFMEQVGQDVSPDLRSQVKHYHAQGQGNKENCQAAPGTNIQIEAESSDDEYSEVPSAVRPLKSTRARVWDTNSLAQSLASGTASLCNPVKELFGNAVARDIAVELVPQTVKNGFRLLTHDSTGTKSWAKLYRWMAFRRMPWTDILNLCQVPSDLKHPPQCVWHIVIYELRPRKNGKIFVVAQYFKDGLDIIFDAMREQFAWLDEDDDVAFIETPLRNEAFLSILKHYFETGDQSNSSLYHTLAKVSLWSEGTLLNRCCELGLAQCVRVLIERYTPQSAPELQPWLQMADPLWQEAGWGNSAFHSAAWCGHAEIMRVLWSWAKKHGQTSKVGALKNKQRQNTLDVVEARLLKCQQNGKDHSPFAETFNVIAEGFGKKLKPLNQLVCLDNSARGNPIVVLIDKQDARQCFGFPSCQLSLSHIVEHLIPLSSEFVAKDIDTVLFLHVHIVTTDASENTREKEAEAAFQLLHLLFHCRRIAFMKSSASLVAATCLCSAVGRVLRLLPEQDVLWQSLAVLPRITGNTQGDPSSFAAALEHLILVLQETCAFNIVTKVDLPAGTTTGYLPESSNHLPVVLKTILRIKCTAAQLLGDSPESWRESELYRRLKSDFTSQNPLLSGPAALERRLLQKPALFEAETVLECLHPAWPKWVEAYANFLVATVLAMTQWAPRIAKRSVDEGEEGLKLLRKMSDDALLFLLKMRPCSVRPGLNLVPFVLSALMVRRSEAEVCFPLVFHYVSSKLASPACSHQPLAEKADVCVSDACAKRHVSLQKFWRLASSNVFAVIATERTEEEFPPALKYGCSHAVNPFQVFFAHDSISPNFRNGKHLDATIEAALEGKLQTENFPAIEAVRFEGKLFALCGNRRLFLFRVLASLNVAHTVKVKLLPWNSDRVRCLKWDEYSRSLASKWDRSFTTTNGGQFVRVKSNYARWQLPPGETHSCTQFVLASRRESGRERAVSISLCRRTSMQGRGGRRAVSVDSVA